MSVALLLALGCVTDPCRALCVDLAASVEGCLPGWGVTWSQVGVDSRRAWRVACQDAWAATRASMEVRQVPAAEDACADASGALEAASCDDVAAMLPTPPLPEDSGYP